VDVTRRRFATQGTLCASAATLARGGVSWVSSEVRGRGELVAECGRERAAPSAPPRMPAVSRATAVPDGARRGPRRPLPSDPRGRSRRSSAPRRSRRAPADTSPRSGRPGERRGRGSCPPGPSWTPTSWVPSPRSKERMANTRAHAPWLDRPDIGATACEVGTQATRAPPRDDAPHRVRAPHRTPGSRRCVGGGAST